ncbi:cornifelin homolog A-like [Ciona intestinalis]
MTNNVAPFQAPQVVTQQPATFLVQTNAQQANAAHNKEWSSGMFACCDDMNICCCVWFCSLCYVPCSMAPRMKENCCVGYFGNVAMRSRFRALHHIKGSICSDWCSLFWCGPCATCQLAREMDKQGYNRVG